MPMISLTIVADPRKRYGCNHVHSTNFPLHFPDIPVTVVMPVVAPIMKIENCKNYGAHVIIHGQNIEEARTHALVIGREKGLLYING